MSLLGAVEAGGTKCVCAVGSEVDHMLARTVIPTTTPGETLGRIIEFFVSCRSAHGDIERIGVGSFGPVCLRRTSDYGRIGPTPKKGWDGARAWQTLSEEVGSEVVVDTDVNCALLGEARLGAGRNVKDVVYFTVGTGVGGAVMVDGRIAHGFSHPEIGHMPVPKESLDMDFSGVCRFHGDACLEGLASGPAVRARAQQAPEDLREGHVVWEIESRYLAVACLNALLWSAPRRIILAGGVMQQRHLFPRIRSHVRSLLGGCIDLRGSDIDIEDVIVPGDLLGNAGIAGAFELARGGA